MHKSIKGKLILWLSLVMALFLAGASVYLHNRLDRILLESVDNLLYSKVQLITGLIIVDELHIEIELSEVVQGEYAIPRSGHYYRVLNWNAKEIARSPSLENVTDFPPVQLPRSVSERYETIARGPAGEPVRWLTHTFQAQGGRYLVVQAGERLTETYKLEHIFSRLLMIAAPLGLLLLLAGAVVTVNVSLKPLRSFSDSIGSITHKNLNDRIDPGRQDRELHELTNSFNTMLDRLESAFEQEQRFVSDASHELRTPITVIKSQCEVILRRERTPQEYRESLEMIRVVSNRMGGLVESLLAIARLDAAVPLTRHEPVSVADLARSAVYILRPISEEHQVTVRYGEIAEGARVMGDSTKLTEVIVNLMENGVRYNKPGGSVVVDVACRNNEVVVSVRDTGQGIPEDSLGRVFDRFWRADESRSTGGTGLGLSIVKRIVDAHDGRIEVESTVGEGSCFRVYLPRST